MPPQFWGACLRTECQSYGLCLLGEMERSSDLITGCPLPHSPWAGPRPQGLLGKMEASNGALS